MLNRFNLKEKIYIFTTVVVILVIAASQVILGTTKNLDKSFSFYKEKAVKGKIALLEISSDLNFISRCSRDLMLGNDFYTNFEKIKKLIGYREEFFNFKKYYR